MEVRKSVKQADEKRQSPSLFFFRFPNETKRSKINGFGKSEKRRWMEKQKKKHQTHEQAFYSLICTSGTKRNIHTQSRLRETMTTFCFTCFPFLSKGMAPKWTPATKMASVLNQVRLSPNRMASWQVFSLRIWNVVRLKTRPGRKDSLLRTFVPCE